MSDLSQLSDEQLAQLYRRLRDKPVNGAAPTRAPNGGLLDEVKDSWAGGLFRGLVYDVPDAGAQMITRGLETIAPSGSDFEAWARGQREHVEATNRERDRIYREEWRRGKDVGMDWGRAIGQSLATLPLTRGIGTAPTLLGRSAQAAGAGGTGGLFEPVQDADSNAAFWLKKAGQGTLGAVAGGAAAPAAELLIKGGVKGAEAALNFGRGLMARQGADDAARRVVVETLTERGVDPSKLSRDVVDSLVTDARTAMARYGGADPAAIARVADFRQLGVEPLQAWVTRDPVSFTRTENLAGIPQVGEALQQAKARLNQTLVGEVAGGARGTQYELGSAAERAMRAVNAADDKEISQLYGAFRNVAPKFEGNGARFVDRVSRAWDEQMVAGPAAIVERLQKIGHGKFPITFSTLEQMRKAANTQLSGASGDARMALGLFKKSVDEEMLAMADDVARYAPPGGAQAPTAGDAVKAIKQARQTFADVASKREAAPALAAVADGTLAPETFFRNYVQGGTVKQVHALWAAVPDGEFRGALKAQMLDAAKQAAIGAASDETGTFSAAGFSRFMQSPGMKEKLAIVLGPDGLAQLERVQRVADNALRYPAGHKVNTSNTSQAVTGRMLDFIDRLPGVGPTAAFMIRPARDAVMASEAAGLASAGPRQFGTPLTLWDEPRKRAAYTLSGLLALPAAGAAYAPFR